MGRNFYGYFKPVFIDRFDSSYRTINNFFTVIFQSNNHAEEINLVNSHFSLSFSMAARRTFSRIFIVFLNTDLPLR